jgi:hypothetical protein
MRPVKGSLVAFFLLLITSPLLLAHATGENYVFLNIRADSIDGLFELHERELDKVLEIDLEADAAAALRTINETGERAEAYIRQNFAIGSAGKTYDLVFTGRDILEVPQGRFAKYHFEMATGPVPDVLDIRNTLLHEAGRFHRGLLVVVENEKTGQNYGLETPAMVFSSSTSQQQLDLNNVPKVLGAKQMIPQGILHIWIGLDHILFLLCLLLPSVLVYTGQKPAPAPNFRKVFLQVLKIVTLFTIAHSVTLALAALDFITLSSRLVESVIALSIILVAVNNFFWRINSATSVLIVVLGLFHGLGFASVMGELPFRMDDVLKVVLGFNIGVELGQIMIVAIIFPVLYFLRKHPLYNPLVLNGGSAMLALVASYWFVERAFGLG